MTRNIVLLVSTTAVLLILFIGYVQFMQVPGAEQPDQRAVVTELPDEAELAGDQTMQIGPAEIPGGQGMEFTVYDEHTGRPTLRFRCDNWRPVPDAKNEVYVESPEFTKLLPSGMVAVVSADEGQITAERLEKRGIKPKMGWLRGNARIVIDTETGRERSPMSARPGDLITITMDRLEFDLDLGLLKSDAAVTATATEFQIAGVGIKLVWNQADNRVETFRIEQGREITLYVEGGLFGNLYGASQETPAPATQAASRPSSPNVAETRPRRQDRRRSGYACTLTGDIVAQHWRGAELLGGLEADELQLLFDVGTGAGRLLARSRQSSSAPASLPAAEQRERLVVRWSGGLSLAPAAQSSHAAEPRRRLTAIGSPLRLTRGDGSVTCGRLEYYDETGQIWLYAAERGRVDFAMRADLSASARSVYVDRANNVVKLVGDVSLEARRDDQAGRRSVGVRCAYWAELHLEPGSGASAADEVIDYGKLKSAVFVGDVQARLAEETLRAHRLELYFRPGRDGEPPEALLTSAVALGDVRMTGRDLDLACGQMRLTFDTTEDGQRYPRALEAAGAVVVSDTRGRLSGDRLRATMAPRRGGAPPQDATPALRTLNVWGKATLNAKDDADKEVAARGAHIAATFRDANEFQDATVTGKPNEHASVFYEPYRVRGERIELAWPARTLHVSGPARLSFSSKRGLRGERRRRPLPIDVTSRESLDIDGQNNTVHFVGDVTASSGNDRLRAAALTLLLEDVEAAPSATRPAGPTLWGAYRRRVQEMLFGQDAARQEPSWSLLGLGKRDDGGRVRKEPVRLLARRAVFERETYERGDPRPLMHSSIAAPEIEVDIRQRIVRTRGETTLLLTDRRWQQDQQAARGALGLPSALLTRGPSQTAMKCDKGLTYVVGADGPDAQDQVLFEGGVVFRHVAGREMVDLEQMLPDVVNRPELLAQLKSRNAYMECDRLECTFAAADRGAQPGQPADAAGPSMRLSWLLASGNVYLRDQQDAVIRSVHARQVEFDRPRSIVRVLGWETADARIYSENPETGQFDRPAIGKEFIIQLDTNTIRAGETRGEFRRPGSE